MDFGLSEEQELLQETVRGFVANECPATRLREIFDGDSDHVPALWRGLCELGLAGLAVPEEHGGAGLGVLDLALVSEVLGGGGMPGPFLGHALATLALGWGGGEEQQALWLPKLAAGDVVGALGLPGHLPDAETGDSAVRVARGLASGCLEVAPCAGVADLLLVGVDGGSLALVERGAPGLRVEAVDGLDRTRRLARVELADTPCELLAGGEVAAPRVRDAALVLLAADAFGAAWQLLRMTIDYAGTRQQFGTPIAQFQAVKHQLADAATALEPARGLLWYAAYAVDHLPERAAHAAAVAKAHIGDRALEVAKTAVELHGGIGYTWECDVHIWLKRVLFDRAWLGTPEIHRQRSAELAGW
jgi:alkylation response protein AidB-like acyl-CoA dehydrogenase